MSAAQHAQDDGHQVAAAAERRWAWVVAGIVLVLVGAMVATAMHWGAMPPSRVETVDPRQLRKQARAMVRERKFDEAYKEWISDLRAKAFIEHREAPLQ